MDPNATYEILSTRARQILEREDTEDEHAVEMAEHFQALDQWLHTGGFLPSAWQR